MELKLLLYILVFSNTVTSLPNGGHHHDHDHDHEGHDHGDHDHGHGGHNHGHDHGNKTCAEGDVDLGDIIKSLGIKILGKDQESPEDVAPSEDHNHLNVKALINELFFPSEAPPPLTTTPVPQTSTASLPIKSHQNGWNKSPVDLIMNNSLLEPVFEEKKEHHHHKVTTQSPQYLTETQYYLAKDELEHFGKIWEDRLREGKSFDDDVNQHLEENIDKPVIPVVDTRWANFLLVHRRRRNFKAAAASKSSETAERTSTTRHQHLATTAIEPEAQTESNNLAGDHGIDLILDNVIHDSSTESPVEKKLRESRLLLESLQFLVPPDQNQVESDLLQDQENLVLLDDFPQPSQNNDGLAIDALIEDIFTQQPTTVPSNIQHLSFNQQQIQLNAIHQQQLQQQQQQAERDQQLSRRGQPLSDRTPQLSERKPQLSESEQVSQRNESIRKQFEEERELRKQRIEEQERLLRKQEEEVRKQEIKLRKQKERELQLRKQLEREDRQRKQQRERTERKRKEQQEREEKRRQEQRDEKREFEERRRREFRERQERQRKEEERKLEQQERERSRRGRHQGNRNKGNFSSSNRGSHRNIGSSTNNNLRGHHSNSQSHNDDDQGHQSHGQGQGHHTDSQGQRHVVVTAPPILNGQFVNVNVLHTHDGGRGGVVGDLRKAKAVQHSNFQEIESRMDEEGSSDLDEFIDEVLDSIDGDDERLDQLFLDVTPPRSSNRKSQLKNSRKNNHQFSSRPQKPFNLSVKQGSSSAKLQQKSPIISTKPFSSELNTVSVSRPQASKKAILEAKRKGDSLKAFDCHDKPPGLYADTLSDCKRFIMCHENGRMGTFKCPDGTLFNQAHQICDWRKRVECEK